MNTTANTKSFKVFFAPANGMKPVWVSQATSVEMAREQVAEFVRRGYVGEFFAFVRGSRVAV
jgi:hypothetical protein